MFRAICFQSSILCTLHSLWVNKPSSIHSLALNICLTEELPAYSPWCPYLTKDGKLLKAGTLAIFIFLFPECLVQWISVCTEFKQHRLRRGLKRSRASCLQKSLCTYQLWCVSLKDTQEIRFHKLSIIHELSTFLQHSHLVHGNFGGFISAGGICYKC